MSTQNKYDLVLIGNLIVDQIYCVNNWHKQGTSNNLYCQYRAVGGLGNIINIITNKLNIFVEGVIGNDDNGEFIKEYLKPTKHFLHTLNGQTSTALIVSNLEKGERTSFVNWGVGENKFAPTPYTSSWTHISYLDIIPNLDIKKIRKTSNIVSADLCLHNPTNLIKNKVLSQLQYLDYLIISKTELFSYLNIEISNISKYKLKHLVVHCKEWTHILENNTYDKIINKNKILENINVLGAGDTYCANFILYQLTKEKNSTMLPSGRTTNTTAAEWAHNQTTDFLKKRKTIPTL